VEQGVRVARVEQEQQGAPVEQVAQEAQELLDHRARLEGLVEQGMSGGLAEQEREGQAAQVEQAELVQGCQRRSMRRSVSSSTSLTTAHVSNLPRALTGP
jgi:hypothetical protein